MWQWRWWEDEIWIEVLCMDEQEAQFSATLQQKKMLLNWLVDPHVTEHSNPMGHEKKNAGLLVKDPLQSMDHTNFDGL